MECRTYATRDDFYEDRGGRWSVERGFGVMNKDDLDLFDAPMRLAPWQITVRVVDETGDVYASCLLTKSVALLGTLGVINPQATKSAALLGPLGVINPQAREPSDSRELGPTYQLAEQVFEGHAEGDTPGRPLSWFVERIPAPAATSS